METKSVEEIPTGEHWQYEPKWDGFRCIAFRRGEKIFLQSKAGQPLARYFPDVVEALAGLPARDFIIDGELVIAVKGRFSFDELQLRLHPAASRVQKLAAAHPAIFIVFDLLEDETGKVLIKLPLRQRRAELVKFVTRNLKSSRAIKLSPATTSFAQAKKWFAQAGGNLDGVIAKRLDAPYASGERTAAVKVKNIRTADCVIGGFRYATGSKLIGSLLLGLYDDAGLLHHVGFTSAFKSHDKRELTKKFEA
jgi:ATP-dependent DNA ligase